MKLALALALAFVFAASVGAQDSTVYMPGDGVSLPQVVTQVRAQYTQEARDNRIEGKVGLSAVVRADGTVGEVSVTESLDSIYGLDANAPSSFPSRCARSAGNVTGDA